MDKNDVVLLPDGRMMQITDLDRLHTDLVEVQFIDRDEPSYLGLHMFPGQGTQNLGQSKEVLTTFYANRSVHLRLNRISKL